MANRTSNYSAFYVKEPFSDNVKEPFSDSTLGPHAKKDFVSYNMLRAWKGKDSSFPFNDAHNKNYNVRDESDWEKTLKPRLRNRISKSKNLILFLSSSTKSSKALREEIDYSINEKDLPVIVIYPEYSEKSDIINCESKSFKKQITDLWDKLPIFKNSMNKVPTLHIPMKKSEIEKALKNKGFMVNTKKKAGTYFYPC